MKKATVPELKPELSKLIKQLQKKLAGAVKVDAQARHEIGLAVKKVRGDRAKYGARALKELERAFGFDENTLRRFEKVAGTWTPTQLDRLVEKTNKNGAPLSWSHLELLAHVSTDARRKKLLDKTLAEALTVRELEALVHRHRAAKNESMGDDAQSRCVQIRQVTSRVVEMAKTVSQIDPLLDVEDVAAVPEYHGAVQEAAQAYSTLRSACDEAIAKLEGKLKLALPPPAKPVAV